jgi:hypothetical protein
VLVDSTVPPVASVATVRVVPVTTVAVPRVVTTRLSSDSFDFVEFA